jgi:hypothetical protein
MFTIVEKIIYELAMFHFKRLNIEYDPNRYFIEYWWKNKKINTNETTNEIHVFCTENRTNIITNF